MRTAIYDYIVALPNAVKGTFTTTEELPWDNNGNPLYLSNLKRIYVDTDQVDQDAQYNTLGYPGTIVESTTVRAYFVCDAKQLPSNYETLVSAIKDARLTTDIDGVTSRRCQVATEYSADKLVTTFEFSFNKTLTN